jgi:hypothetical protein
MLLISREDARAYSAMDFWFLLLFDETELD